MTSERTPDFTAAEFRARIGQMMRLRETGKQWSVIGGPRARQCVLRKPQPTKKDKK